MPYKDPEKRREQWRRWSQEHRTDKQRQEKEYIRAYTRLKLPKQQICSIKGCAILAERHHPDYSKPLEIIWLCNKHHDLVHKPIPLFCSKTGCEKPHRAKGLCNAHHMNARNLSKREKITLDEAIEKL